jgi:hypothetical protein
VASDPVVQRLSSLRGLCLLALRVSQRLESRSKSQLLNVEEPWSVDLSPFVSSSIHTSEGIEGVVHWKAPKSQSLEKALTIDLGAGCELLILVVVWDFYPFTSLEGLEIWSVETTEARSAQSF